MRGRYHRIVGRIRAQIAAAVLQHPAGHVLPRRKAQVEGRQGSIAETVLNVYGFIARQSDEDALGRQQPGQLRGEARDELHGVEFVDADARDGLQGCELMGRAAQLAAEGLLGLRRHGCSDQRLRIRHG